ncbi:GIN domain-containing protein [Chryseobacterium koreense]
MKRNCNISYILLISLFFIISCGKITPKGKIESRDFPVEDFTEVNLQGKFRVFYVNGEKSFVNLETYSNIIENLNLKVKDKTLNITENRETQGVDFYNITIYSKYSPEKMVLSDSLEMNISSEIKTDHFRLKMKNNAKFIGSVNSRKAEIEMKNASRANFLGKTRDAVIKISDTANIIAPYWMITNLDIDSRNGNYAELNVKDTLKGNIRNTAKFVYYNDPIRVLKIDKTANVQNKVLE